MTATIFRLMPLLVTGLLSGAFLYGFLNVVPTFYEVPVEVHLIYRKQLMAHNGITMQILMGLSILLPLIYAIADWKHAAVRNFALIAVTLAIVTLLITRLGNVPINQVIKTWPPTSPPEGFTKTLHKWDTYNTLRTLTAIGCFIFSLLAFLDNTPKQ